MFMLEYMETSFDPRLSHIQASIIHKINYTMQVKRAIVISVRYGPEGALNVGLKLLPYTLKI
jgi:hypothetical protein